MKPIPQFDPRLRTPSERFDFNKGVDGYTAESLVALLKETMKTERGIGLSACQLGINTRVFCMGNPDESDSIVPVFNPVIVNIDDEEVYVEEGCISFPGLFIKIKRPRAIRVRYANITGDVNTISFDGMTARVFLHEYDHLDGIVFTQRANYINLEKAQTQQKKFNRQRKRNAKNQ